MSNPLHEAPVKLLLTIAVIVAAWFVLKRDRQALTGKISRFMRAATSGWQAMNDSVQARKPGPPARKDAAQPLDLEPCGRCGAYKVVGSACSCTKS
jgi:hypothetical protein